MSAANDLARCVAVFDFANGELVSIRMLFSLEDFGNDHIVVEPRSFDLFHFHAGERQHVRQFFRGDAVEINVLAEPIE